jgi:hypothetical protein
MKSSDLFALVFMSVLCLIGLFVIFWVVAPIFGLVFGPLVDAHQQRNSDESRVSKREEREYEKMCDAFKRDFDERERIRKELDAAEAAHIAERDRRKNDEETRQVTALMTHIAERRLGPW